MVTRTTDATSTMVAVSLRGITNHPFCSAG
jgi:hypothetical protein